MLSLDVVSLGVPDVSAAQAFYASVFSLPSAELDLHGAGRFALAPADGAPSGVVVLSVVVDQPSGVERLADAASRHGGTVLKPARKALFAGFSAVFQAPGGTIWKPAAESRKDTGPAADPPIPTETAVLLGVADPKASKAFYTALGLTVDRDYGSKYIDFEPAPGRARLGLMTRKALAKDAGVGEDARSAVVLSGTVASRDEVDAVLATAASSGGRIAAAAVETGSGAYAGRFTDPDGFLWTVLSS